MLCITVGLHSGDTNAITGGPHTANRRAPRPRSLNLLQISFLSFCRMFVKTGGPAFKLRLKSPSCASAQSGCKCWEQRLITIAQTLRIILMSLLSREKEKPLVMCCLSVCKGKEKTDEVYWLKNISVNQKEEPSFCCLHLGWNAGQNMW